VCVFGVANEAFSFHLFYERDDLGGFFAVSTGDDGCFVDVGVCGDLPRGHYFVDES
jgi:hypothetical protein